MLVVHDMLSYHLGIQNCDTPCQCLYFSSSKQTHVTVQQHVICKHVLQVEGLRNEYDRVTSSQSKPAAASSKQDSTADSSQLKQLQVCLLAQSVVNSKYRKQYLHVSSAWRLTNFAVVVCFTGLSRQTCQGLSVSLQHCFGVVPCGTMWQAYGRTTPI